jgi:iron-sulfur cluster repair protein YtfE (RIC family)
MALALTHERDDGLLLDELARLIERLRLNRYQSVLLRIQNPATFAAEEFSDLFSRHLLYEEDILFPVLREPAPAAAGKRLDKLKHEHETLRSFSRELVDRVRQNDLDGACKAARLFMAALLDHIARETRVTTSLLRSLDPRAADRLHKALDSNRGPE